jgi:hypothetical protein
MRQSREDLILSISSLIASCADSNEEQQESLLDEIAERICEYKKSRLENKKDRIAMQDYFKEILN